MADAYSAKQSADSKPKKLPDAEAGEVCRTALERYRHWHTREEVNTTAAYEDLEFCWADNQWPSDVVQERNAPDNRRPMLTVNRLPQFVHQVTGDMRQMKPAIKVVPVDNRGDKDTAETVAGMIRYVENRSDATAIYTGGADSQVSCGIGAWRVNKEYASDSTFNQELRIVGVDDAVSIAFDPDAVLPTREDAKWCIVPVDMSREAFKEQYPDCPIEDFDDADLTPLGWFSDDFIRVAEYWVKKPMKRKLALLPDGAIVDLTNKDETVAAQYLMQGARIEERDSYKVCRYLITCAHVLEGPIDWPGMFIPIVPAIGEEIRIGRRVVRRGLVRSAKDSQRMFNYFCTAQAEVVGLQPKAPFMVTERNVEKYQNEWGTANTKNWPFLPYEPDPKNGGQAPQRVPPPVSSQGISEGIALAAENMKAVIGIYDASLGARSNETSGKAILARQREGDTGSFLYIDNWSRAIRHTGKILIDLIPHVYDTERMIRIMGEDGKVDLKWINRSVGIVQTDPYTGEEVTTQKVENDVTVGAYDVVLETGPSYTTKRAEARESLVEFVRAAPQTAPAIMDLVAKAQDWPLADEVAKRMEVIAPPQVAELISRQKGEAGEEEAPKQPTPQEQMQMQAAQLELADKSADVQGKQLNNQKLAQELQSGGVDPVQMVKAQGEQQRLQFEAQENAIKLQVMQEELEFKRQKAAIDLQIAMAELEIKRAGMVQSAQQHAVSMAQGDEKHRAGLDQAAEMAKAKAKAKPERPAAN